MSKNINENEELFARLFNQGQNRADMLADALQVARIVETQNSTEIINGNGSIDRIEYDKECFDTARKMSAEIRAAATNALKTNGNTEMLDVIKTTLLFDAPHNFDCYCRYLEWNREKTKKFYEPRRTQLKPIAEDLQRLSEGGYEILGISMPPGTGKTTLAEFFLTWVAGKEPELTTLSASHSLSFMRGVFDELTRIFDGNAGEYLWKEVFPNSPICKVDRYDLRIDLGTKKRFETLEFTATGSQNAGKVRASNLLYCDDLVEGIDQAMSQERLERLWQQYRTDLRQRKIGSCRELHIATRWSLLDPIGRLSSMYYGNPKAKFIAYPAVDENGISNFDYPYGLGFTTEFYEKQMQIMDRASWECIYMNNPIEREGILYSTNELRYYYSLPDTEPDAIMAVCDTKNKGEDFCVMPIVYQYGTDYYVDKFICDCSKPEVVDERVARALYDNAVQYCEFESNNAGGRVADNINEKIKALGGITKITQKWHRASKDTRILVASSWVKQHCLFRDKSTIQTDADYKAAMKMLTGYTLNGRVKHDDVPDAMASLYEFLTGNKVNKAFLVQRPF